MNIITQNSDNVVLFAEPNITIDSNGIYGDGWVYNGLTSSTALLTSGVTLPVGFLLGAWSYLNGTWAITNTVAVNAFVAKNLQAAQSAQVQILTNAYQTAITQPVSFTSASGVTKLFQADPQSVYNLQGILASYTPAGSTPSGFYWVAADNTLVPMVLSDLQGMAKLMGAQGWAQFQHLQTLKSKVLAATTISAVEAITF